MALINCPECHEQVSSTAKNCPKCGKPIKQQTGCLGKIGALFLVLMILSMLGQSCGLSNDKNRDGTNGCRVCGLSVYEGGLCKRCWNDYLEHLVRKWDE